jgi:hypothetical protein
MGNKHALKDGGVQSLVGKRVCAYPCLCICAICLKSVLFPDSPAPSSSSFWRLLSFFESLCCHKESGSRSAFKGNKKKTAPFELPLEGLFSPFLLARQSELIACNAPHLNPSFVGRPCSLLGKSTQSRKIARPIFRPLCRSEEKVGKVFSARKNRSPFFVRFFARFFKEILGSNELKLE